MSSKQAGWRSSRELAYAEASGPGRPPDGPSGRAILVLVVVLGVTCLFTIVAECLETEDRKWVVALFGWVFSGACIALPALWRGWLAALPVLLASSIIGIGLGLVDAGVEPIRGTLAALGFALAAALVMSMLVQARRLAEWDSDAPGRSPLRQDPGFSSTPTVLSPGVESMSIGHQGAVVDRSADGPAATHGFDGGRRRRRWLRHPLLWAAVVLLLTSWGFVTDVNCARDDEQKYGDGFHVTARTAEGWEGGRDVVLAYRHPTTGEEVQASTYVWDDDRLPIEPGEVPIDVSRTDPEDVVVAGDYFPATENLTVYICWLVLPLSFWAARRLTLWRARRLAAAGSDSYDMLATVSPPMWWRRPGRMLLFPFDAGPDSLPVASVAVVAAPTVRGPFRVEVKGSPRPYGRVVARMADGGAVLWPAARSRHAGRTTLAASALPPAPLALYPGQPWWYGPPSGPGWPPSGPARPGGPIWPGRPAWAPPGPGGPAWPPGPGWPLSGPAWPGGPGWPGGPAWAPPESGGPAWPQPSGPAWPMWPPAGAPAQAPSHWRGLAVVDGRLVFGHPGGSDRPVAWFEEDGLVLVASDGAIVRYPWDHYAEPGTSPATAPHWGLEVKPLRFQADPVVEIRLAVAMNADGDVERCRLADFGPSEQPWEDLPALASYLGATPEARAGLSDAGAVTSLRDGLVSDDWRRPEPPSEPLVGDHLHLFVTVRAVLDEHLWRYAGRTVRGAVTPAVDQLVTEVAARLSDQVRPRIDDARIAEEIHRQVDPGRWPFDVLLRAGPETPVPAATTSPTSS